MKKRSLQEELGRLSGVLMSNKSAGSRFAWNPYFPPGVTLQEEEASEIFYPEGESSDPAVQKTWQEQQAPGALPGTAAGTKGESRDRIPRPEAVSQRRTVLRKAVVLSEIIGEPVCRKRKRKAYGNQGNRSRG